MEKFPSKSVTVPIFVPSMITFTPGIGSCYLHPLQIQKFEFESKHYQTELQP